MAYLLHPDGTTTDLDFIKDRQFATIGKASSCEIRLIEKGVARKHGRLANMQALFYIQPASKKHPILVNNNIVTRREALLQNNDLVSIAGWNMQFFTDQIMDQGEDGGNLKAKAKKSAREEFKIHLHDILLEKMDLKGLDSSAHGKQLIELTTQAKAYIRELMKNHPDDIKQFGDPEELYQEIIDDILGYGPIADLLRDADVSEIMCVGGGKVFVEKHGKLTRSDKHFQNDSQLRAVIERIVGPLGRRIDESSPIVDARLPDGSRVNAIIHPIALDGPSLNVRKFPDEPMKIEDLIGFNSLTKGMGDFLKVAVEHRKNIIIAGGTGSGKTTLLDVVSSFIPGNERIVTIEDSAELRLEQDHVVRLESRPANIEGKGAIIIRDLVKNALRMRPDRIIVGECRGSEALDMLQAMNTGHDGSLTTLHANSPFDAISRLETMVLMAGMELPLRAIRSQIGSAVHIICHQARLSDGTRKIMHISEVTMDTDDEDSEIHLQDIFIFVQTDIDKEGKIIGYYRPTGMIPAFINEMREHGLDVDMSMFVIEN